MANTGTGVVRSRAYLESRFAEGRKPSEDDFKDLLASLRAKEDYVAAQDFSGVYSKADTYFDDAASGIFNGIAFRDGGVVSGLKEDQLGRQVAYIKITTLSDGTPVNDTHIDGVVIRKKGTEYFKMQYGNELPIGYYGVNADTADCSPLINQAIATMNRLGGGVINFPDHNYNCESDILLFDKVYLKGAGKGATTLNFTTATISHACILAEGTTVALPQLSSNVQRGDMSITMASAPSLATGDIYYITDTTPSSFNTARAYYHAGEIFKVNSRAGAVVTNTQIAFGDYATGAARELYKVNPVTCGVTGMSIVGKLGVLLPTVKIHFGVGCTVNDLKLTNGERTLLDLSLCYDTTISGVDGFDNTAGNGYNYGIMINDCQRVIVSNCRMETTRHGVTNGGSNLPSREIQIVGNYIASLQAQPGLDFHGHCEEYIVSSNILPNGISLGGDRATLTGNTITNNNNSGNAVAFVELKGISFVLSNNTFKAAIDFQYLIDARPDAPCSRMGGELVIKGNRFEFEKIPTGLPANSAGGVLFYPQATSTHGDFTVTLMDNSFKSNVAITASFFAIACIPKAAYGIKEVLLDGNVLKNTGLIETHLSVQKTVIANNICLDAPSQGVKLYAAPVGALAEQTVIVRGNVINYSRKDSVYIYTPGTTVDLYVNIHNNDLTNPCRGGSAYSIWLDTAERASVKDNIVGEIDPTPNFASGTMRFENINYLYSGRNSNVGKDYNSLTVSKVAITNDNALGDE